MTRPLFSKSTRKYIRFQKARIRREILDFKKQQELIQELHQRFVGKSKKKEEKAKKVAPRKAKLITAGEKK